jgi:hypothetical protein
MPMNPRLLRPTPSGFTPAKLAGLELWLDFSDQSTVTTATGISSVTDKSGNGRTFSQAVANNQPSYTNTQNGRKVATFDGADDSLDGPNIISAKPATILHVCFFPSYKNIGVTFEQLTAANVIPIAIYRGLSDGGGLLGKFRLFNGENLANTTETLNNVWLIIGGVFDTTTASKTYYNGINETTGNAGTLAPSGSSSQLAFWDGGVGVGKYTPMRLAEMAIYSRALSADEILSVSRHWARKWGFTL